MLFLHFAFAFAFSALALFAANDNFGLDLVLLKSVSDPIQALYASILHGSAALDSLSAPALDSVGAAALMRATQDDVELAVEQELVEVPVVVELTTQNASAFEWPKLDFDADLDGSASATVGGRCTLISALLALVSGGCLMVFVYIQRSIAPTSLAPVIRAAAAPVFIASISVSPAAAAAPARGDDKQFEPIITLPVNITLAAVDWTNVGQGIIPTKPRSIQQPKAAHEAKAKACPVYTLSTRAVSGSVDKPLVKAGSPRRSDPATTPASPVTPSPAPRAARAAPRARPLKPAGWASPPSHPADQSFPSAIVTKAPRTSTPPSTWDGGKTRSRRRGPPALILPPVTGLTPPLIRATRRHRTRRQPPPPLKFAELDGAGAAKGSTPPLAQAATKPQSHRQPPPPLFAAPGAASAPTPLSSTPPQAATKPQSRRQPPPPLFAAPGAASALMPMSSTPPRVGATNQPLSRRQPPPALLLPPVTGLTPPLIRAARSHRSRRQRLPVILVTEPDAAGAPIGCPMAKS